MIVLDASVVVELLTEGPLAGAIREKLSAQDETLAVPHLLDVEVASALRRLTQGQPTHSHRTNQFLDALATLPADRYSHIPLLRRIWELRHNFTAYDATYIALAEATDSVLYTADRRLERGHRARVALFGA